MKFFASEEEDDGWWEPPTQEQNPPPKGPVDIDGNPAMALEIFEGKPFTGLTRYPDEELLELLKRWKSRELML